MGSLGHRAVELGSVLEFEFLSCLRFVGVGVGAFEGCLSRETGVDGDCLLGAVGGLVPGSLCGGSGACLVCRNVVVSWLVVDGQPFLAGRVGVAPTTGSRWALSW